MRRVEDDGSDRILVRLSVPLDAPQVRPSPGLRHVLQRMVLPLRGPFPAELVPHPALGGVRHASLYAFR